MRQVAMACAMAVLLMLAMGADSCNSVDEEQARQTMQMAGEAQRQIGMPGIANFTERKFVKYLYELRDQDGFGTYTYIVDMTGGLHFVCESIGYGIPYSAQFVNPDRAVRWRGETVTLPQPEPNGLFIPDGLSATWILCVDGNGGVRPIYSEPALLVSPFELKSASSYQ